MSKRPPRGSSGIEGSSDIGWTTWSPPPARFLAGTAKLNAGLAGGGTCGVEAAVEAEEGGILAWLVVAATVRGGADADDDAFLLFAVLIAVSVVLVVAEAEEAAVPCDDSLPSSALSRLDEREEAAAAVPDGSWVLFCWVLLLALSLPREGREEKDGGCVGMEKGPEEAAAALAWLVLWAL